MRFGVTLPNCGVGDDPRTVIELAAEAEAAGWEGVFVWDFPIGSSEIGNEDVQKIHEAWALLAGIALRTETVAIGTMITPLAWRSPWMVAKQAATMQAMSDGRFVLSVGLGAPPAAGTQFYEPTDRRVRAQMLDEGLRIVGTLWSGEPLELEGKHYRVRNGPEIKPVPLPRPKLWVVGGWNLDPDVWPKKRSFRRALRWDGILPHIYQGPEMAETNADTVGAMCADIARERSDPFDIVLEGGGEKEDVNAAPDEVRAFRDAGATWWLEAVWWSMYRHPGDIGPMRERIRQGPPKL